MQFEKAEAERGNLTIYEAQALELRMAERIAAEVGAEREFRMARR